MYINKRVIDPDLLGGRNVIDFVELNGQTHVPVALIDPDDSPISVDGLPFHENNKTFCRLPDSLIHTLDVNYGVLGSGAHRPAGAVMRFRTNSNLIGIRAIIGYNAEDTAWLRRSYYSFAFYEGTGKNKTVAFTVQPSRKREVYFGDIRGENTLGEEKEWTVYFPYLTSVPYVRIILNKDAYIAEPTPFTVPDPILFYGSSISNGIDASHSGNIYTSLIGRELDANVINWGFNGSAKGEPDMAKLITLMPHLSLFVMAYDNNSPSPENLKATHKPFFDLIRRAHPELPIILMTRPQLADTDEAEERRQIIKETYDAAVAAGDRKVWYYNAGGVFAGINNECTSDGCHPNDRGFKLMADDLLPLVKQVLSEEGYRV